MSYRRSAVTAVIVCLAGLCWISGPPRRHQAVSLFAGSRRLKRDLTDVAENGTRRPPATTHNGDQDSSRKREPF